MPEVFPLRSRADRKIQRDKKNINKNKVNKNMCLLYVGLLYSFLLVFPRVKLDGRAGRKTQRCHPSSRPTYGSDRRWRCWCISTRRGGMEQHVLWEKEGSDEKKNCRG